MYSDSAGTKLRAVMSVPPPGAAGTMRRIALAGYCAQAWVAATIKTIDAMSFFMLQVYTRPTGGLHGKNLRSRGGGRARLRGPRAILAVEAGARGGALAAGAGHRHRRAPGRAEAAGGLRPALRHGQQARR